MADPEIKILRDEIVNHIAELNGYENLAITQGTFYKEQRLNSNRIIIGKE